jgi:23S rRNA (pseudouridine1915-N3)-methyltransferase
MNIDLIAIGKTDSKEINALVEMYMKRINRRVKFSVITLPDVKAGRAPEAAIKRQEGEAILRQIAPTDRVVLLDEHGSEYRSVEFARWLDGKMNTGVRRLMFVIGGPYGFSDEVYARADEKISLSRMTFSHQIIRAIFAEQLYRALSIIYGEPYHHE